MSAVVGGLRRAFIAILALCLLAGCGSIKSKLGIGPPRTDLRSLTMIAEQGANQGNATQIDIVVVYDDSVVARLPKTGPDWFRQRDALQKELATAIEVVSLEVDTPSAGFAVKLPKKVRKSFAVYAFANYVAPEGWPLIALAPYRKATLRLQSTSIALEQK